MASLKDLRRRIRATKSMQQIFKAMEMVAAAKLRRAQQRALASSPYAQKITEMLNNLAGAASDLDHPLFQIREPKTTALVVITADRGFAGAYNTNVLRVVEQRLRQAPPGSIKIVAVGRKGRDYLRRRGYPILSARKNAGELVDSLTLTRNRLRQAAITREIAELVGGAEALK